MGQEIDKTEFSAAEREEFAGRLNDNLGVLRTLLARPGFGEGPASLGAELELYILDEHGRPLPQNQQLLDATGDERLTLELNRYNIEANLTPCLLSDAPLASLEAEMESMLELLNREAASLGGRVIPIGILPTLVPDDLSIDMMTPEDRYRAMLEQLRSRRKERFHITIEGEDSLEIKTDLVTCEGANTSLQIHYRMPPERFCKVYNTLQLITPLVTAIGANSPMFLGRRLWHETRLRLFQQAVDGRDPRRRALNMPARVHFGHGWLRTGPYELFAESVCLYRTLLPVKGDEDVKAVLAEGGVPELQELAMHMGTIWPWNRAVYDHHDGGHVRVELRFMPAGPTSIDMVANTALALGLAEGLSEHIEAMIPAMPQKVLEQNLELAAQYGIKADLLWPSLERLALEQHPVTTIVESLLPVAEQGLQSIGMPAEDIRRYLGCIEQRLATGQNGASWQLDQHARYMDSHERDEAADRMVHRYTELSLSNQPVASWDID